MEVQVNKCKQKCSLCEMACKLKDLHSLHLCNKMHSCGYTCELEGMCSKDGKVNCAQSIEKWSLEHKGRHQCNEGIHLCEAICPCCLGYCEKKLRHKGYHRRDEHLVYENGL